MPRFSKPAIFAIVLIAAAAVVAAVAVVAGNLSFAPPSLTRTVQSFLTRTGARAASVGSVSIVPLRRMSIDSLCATLPDPAGGTVTVRVGRIDIGYSPVRLFRKGRRLRAAAEAVLERKGMTALTKLEKLLYALSAAGLEDVIDAVDARGIDLHSEAGAVGPLRVCGGSLWYVSAERAGKTAVDTLRVGRRHTLHDVHSVFRLVNDMLDIDSLTGRYAGGHLRGHGVVRLRRRMLDTVTCELSALDAGVWHETVVAGKGILTGDVDVRARFGRSRLVLDSLDGAITVASSGLTAADTPLQKTLATLFGTDAMRRFSFERVGAEMRLAGGRLDVLTAEAAGSPLSFATQGWVRFDGSLSQRLTGSIDRATVDDLSPLVRHVLIRAPNGERRFVCQVTGAFARPVVSLEKGMMKRAVERAIEELIIDN